MSQIELDWKLGHTADPATPPERWVPAVVPGAVQLDWARAEGWAEHWRGDNCRSYEWMEGVYWVYRAALPQVPLEKGQRLYFVCEGIDYQCLVKLAGETIHAQEGMFTPLEIDLTDRSRPGALLEIVVFPAPDSGDYSTGRSEANHCVKPPVGYGWDWHPRLVPLGIWGAARLETRNAAHIREIAFAYELLDDFRLARVDVAVEISETLEGSLEWALSNPEGEVVDAQSTTIDGLALIDVVAEAHDPMLWWPNGEGPQNRYAMMVSLHDAEGDVVDRKRLYMGFRQVRLVMNPGAWDEPKDFPKSRSVPPMTLEVNGRRLFAKGSNWVPPDIFPGAIDRETYEPLLRLAKEAHFNLLRCWGGGIVNKQSFYDLCDEYGLMVWQEFPLACNCYREAPEYLDTLDQESRSIVKALKTHPCLAIWCGGNELFNAWSGMTDQHKALRLLNRNCYELDPDTPFLPTSPVMGVGHGGYVFRDAEGRECFEIFQRAACTAYTEFGCPGPAAADYLRRFIPEEELFPPRPGTAWETHHAFEAWPGHPGSWLCLETIEHYFGRPESLEELVEAGQLLQSQGCKAIFEEARRQKPTCAMALNWCFNEPWPTAANNSLINWPCAPKPAYEAVKQSCRPALASARVARFAWRPGEDFEAELWILNDAPEPIRGARLEAYLDFGDDEIFALAWDFDSVEAGENVRGPTLRRKIPEIEGRTFELRLRVESGPAMNSDYLFCCLPPEGAGAAGEARPMNV